MLIKYKPRKLWTPDPIIGQLVEHFDSEEKINQPWSLNKRERDTIKSEIRKCTDGWSGFAYAARNYFKITTKDKRDILFSLNESQELILDEVKRLYARGRPQRLIILKSRQLGCLDPDTKVLTADLKWKRIDDLVVGENLVAVDEHSAGLGHGHGRKIRTAVVLDKWHTRKVAYRLTLDSGVQVIASGDHKFICKKRGGVSTEWRAVNQKTNVRSPSPIRPGDQIRYITKPWGESTFEDGWFGGLLDGEGSLRHRQNCGGFEANVSQVEGAVLDRARKYLDDRGFTYHEDRDIRKHGTSSKLGNKPVVKLRINRLNEIFRLVGQTRPSRFLHGDWWQGVTLPGKCSGQAYSTVVSVEEVGERDLVDIETSTGTYIAEGLVTHNCSTLIEAMIAWRTMFFPNTNAIVVSNDQNHAAFLFSIMLHIYDQMPWWLKPEISSRKYEGGLVFDNPDEDKRRIEPGLKSRIDVQAATQQGGIGQGRTLSAGHLCFAPDTLVHTGGGVLKRISDVKCGDLVVCSSGQLTPVRAVHKSQRSNEETAEIRPWGSPLPLRTTLDHRVLTPDGYRQAGDIKSGDWIRIPVRPITSSRIEIVTLHNGTGGGPFLDRTSRQTTKKLPCDYSTGWMLGLYLAEGCIQFNLKLKPEYQACAFFSGIDKDEEDHVRAGLSAGLWPGQAVSGYQHKSRTLCLKVNNSGLARFVNENFGHKDQKRVPDWAWDCGEEFCRGLVSGYMFGDGHAATSASEASFVASSIRAAITIQMRALCASLGYGWSSIYNRPAGHYYGRNCQEIWTIGLFGKTAKAIGGLCGKPLKQKTSGKGMKWRYASSGRFVDVQVRTATRGFSEEFFDLEVEAAEHNFCTLQACVANSEFTDWDQKVARDAIEGDLAYALADEKETFAILESTGRGAGNYSHNLWKQNVELWESSERADWKPLFLPWFVDSKHVLAPEKGWEIARPELDMAERVLSQWVRCDNPECGAWRDAVYRGESRVGTSCHICTTGTMQSYLLTPEQLCWMWNRRSNAEKDEDSLKTLLSEQASNAEDAWQVSGFAAFPQPVQAFFNSCVRDPIAIGNLDSRGEFHGVANPLEVSEGRPARCFAANCAYDHRQDEAPLHIWEWPIAGAEYGCGVDVAEGLGGKADYSVAFVNRIGRVPSPDVQVAQYRSNTIDPIGFAQPVNFLGRMYNDALMAIEYNKFDSCANTVLHQYQYPNIYRWKNLDAVKVNSNRWHWNTQMNSKPRLWQTAVRWGRNRLWIVRSKEFAQEVKTFQKDDYDDKSGGAAFGFHDDVLIAGLICLYTSHEMDWDESLGYIPVRASDKEMAASFKWKISCVTCQQSWDSAEPPSMMDKCRHCASLMLTAARMNLTPRGQVIIDIDKEFSQRSHVDVSDLTYDGL